MIVYKLVLSDATEYALNGATVTYPLSGSLSLGDSGSSFENTIIEKSSGPGSVKLGDARLVAQKLLIKLESAFQSDSTYDAFANGLLTALSKAVYLVDVTNSKRTLVAIEECSESYEKGCYKRSIDFLISFAQLTPYWEALTDTVVAVTTTPNSPHIASLANPGSIPTQARISLTAAAACAEASFNLVNENRGMTIEDSLFGTTGFLSLVLDNELGTLKLGTLTAGVLNADALDRRVSIVDGSGFFDVPVGASLLSILSTVALTISITYRRRDFR
jgi:hypothetical protein